jgi:hypothetical protein
VTEGFVVEGGDVGSSRHDGLDGVNMLTLLTARERLKEADDTIRPEGDGGGEDGWVSGSSRKRRRRLGGRERLEEAKALG